MACRRYGPLLAPSRNFLRGLLQVQPDVAEALSSSRPVVALESTIVAHGMPYPQNLEVALEVEDILKSKVGNPNTRLELLTMIQVQQCSFLK